MIKYDEAIGTLCEMFPDYDLDVIKAVLRANRGHFENTVDQLLQSNPTAVSSSTTSSSISAAAASATTTTTNTSSHSASGPAQPQRFSNITNSPIPQNMTREEQIAYDEALAREMQRRILIAQGYNVPMRPQEGPMYQAYQRQQAREQQQQRYQQQQQQQRRQQQQQNPENYEEIDVLQDLKDSMSRMSEAAKLKFREWWSKFSGPGNQSGGNGGKYSALSQDDDDDDEEVAFDSSTLSKRSGNTKFYDTSDAPYGGDDDSEGGIELAPASTFSSMKPGEGAGSSSAVSKKKD